MEIYDDMKRCGLIFLFFSLFAGMAFGQSFTAQVEGMWRTGDHAGVLAIAQTRLAANTNDLPGLLLKCEYELEYLQLDAATNTAAEILRVAPQIETERFGEIRSWVVSDAQVLLDAIPQYPPDEYAADLARAGTITNKSLACGVVLQALEEDGYFR